MDTQPTPTDGDADLDNEAVEPGFPIELVTRGEGAEHARRRLNRALRHVADKSPRRPVFVRASLTFDPHHSLDERAEAKASFDVGGHVVHAHAAAATFTEAIDQLVDRLRHGLHEHAERKAAARRHARTEEPRFGEAGP